MPPRPDDPRRDDPSSRRGSARGQGRGGPADGQLGGISDARAYTPRGRTVRETAELRRTPPATRSPEKFRPALQVLDGGRAAAGAPTRTPPAGDRADQPAPAGRRGTGRPAASAAARGGAGRVPSRPARGADVARPARPRRTGRPKRPAPPPLADPRRRLRLGTFVALVLFVTIGIRLIAIQVLQSPAYADGGLKDRISTVALPAPRGAIYDRSGIALASSVEARYIFADPELVKDVHLTAKALEPLLGIPAADLEPRLVRQKTESGQDSRFQYLARGVPVETAEKVLARELPGIYADRDERRDVPGGDLAANLLGFVNRDMNGLEGLEARYDDLLRGVPGERTYEHGGGDLNAPIPGGFVKETKPQPGSSLELTIDRDLQFKAQSILHDRMKATSGSAGAALVLDVRTGEVLAQASDPTYNAADPKDSQPADRTDNATSFVVDPGSVHKAITMGAALQEGKVRPDDSILVGPTITKADTTFSDTHPPPGGVAVPMSLPGIMAYSSNVGTIKIADRLGKEKLYEYQKKFGLGQATGEGVPGEAPGQLLPPDDWSGSAYGSVPIGMSVSATPLQIAAAYAAIANNGTWVQPHLIKDTIAPDGTRTPAPAPKSHPVLSPGNAAALRTILEAVTTVDHATGLRAAIPGYRVAGKTGTGGLVRDGSYAPGEVASFVGMAPADNPRYVVAVFAYTPGGEGGDVSAPAFKDIMEFTLSHYRVPPTGTKPPNFVVYPR
ncbi:penicillin-binding transpeptidase domain-containing protein [Plantactinospora siamensis]|uniref:Penicillin-binding transpeptidase domain-containing protein n=1 Tax=Plantactinospora siamensis TaxID=555372 RepID=A0ABV6NZJ7_9ACTN